MENFKEFNNFSFIFKSDKSDKFVEIGSNEEVKLNALKFEYWLEVKNIRKYNICIIIKFDEKKYKLIIKNKGKCEMFINYKDTFQSITYLKEVELDAKIISEMKFKFEQFVDIEETFLFKQQLYCVICKMNHSKIIKLNSCSHAFCPNEIFDFLKEKNICPICKMPPQNYSEINLL